MSEQFDQVDAYVAALEDASGMPEAVVEFYSECLGGCKDCGDSGFATTYDGRSLGACPTCAPVAASLSGDPQEDGNDV